MRTIDADALLKKIEEDAEFYLVGDDESSMAVGGTLLGVKEQINAMPTIEPQRMRGRWTKDNACEFCGFRPWYERNINTLSFCPNCGAEMRGTE